jgi:hypothetical protein
MFSIIERSFKFSDNGFGFKIPKICLIKKTCPRKPLQGGTKGGDFNHSQTLFKHPLRCTEFFHPIKYESYIYKTTFLTIEELKMGNPGNKPDIRHDSVDKKASAKLCTINC